MKMKKSNYDLRKIERLSRYKAEIVELNEASKKILESAKRQKENINKNKYDIDQLNETIRSYSHVESLIRHISHTETREKIEELNLKARELEPITHHLEDVINITDNAIDELEKQISQI